MANDKSGHVFHFTVGEEELTTAEHVLTVRQILELAGLEPGTHYLIELKGVAREEHRNLDEEVHIHEHLAFIAIYTGETPVS